MSDWVPVQENSFTSLTLMMSKCISLHLRLCLINLETLSGARHCYIR